MADKGNYIFCRWKGISFEKDNVPFSEEIIIRRGYNLLEKFTDVNDFLEGWEKGILAECHREVIEMKN